MIFFFFFFDLGNVHKNLAVGVILRNCCEHEVLIDKRLLDLMVFGVRVSVFVCVFVCLSTGLQKELQRSGNRPDPIPALAAEE